MVNLIRKVIFVAFAVECYNRPLIQSIACTLSISMTSMLLVFGNPYKSFGLLMINIIPNTLISIVGVINIGYVANETLRTFSTGDLILYGWI